MAYLNGIFTDENSLAAFTKSSGETSCNKKTPRIRQTNPRLLIPRRMFFIFCFHYLKFDSFFFDFTILAEKSTGLNLTDEAKNLRQEHDPGLTLGPTGMAIKRIRNANGTAPHSWLSLHTEAGSFVMFCRSAVKCSELHSWLSATTGYGRKEASSSPVMQRVLHCVPPQASKHFLRFITNLHSSCSVESAVYITQSHHASFLLKMPTYTSN